MRAVHTVIAALLIILYTAVIASSVVLLSLFTAGKWHRTDVLPRVWSRLVLATLGARLHVSGAEKLRGRHFVVVANHQSHVDPPAFMVSIPGKTRFVGKQSLFKIPIFGQALLASGNIPVDRSRAGSASRRLDRARDKVGKVLSVLFFAEGTRSDDGVLLPFKSGAARMAIDTGVPIAPAAIAGSLEVLAKGWNLITPGVVVVRFGEPIDPRGRERDELTAEARAAVERLYEEAKAERTRLLAR